MMFFGVGKLPEVAKTFGQSLKEFKKAQNSDALDVTPTTHELPAESTAAVTEAEPVLAGGGESPSSGS
jgi:Sec-independent protein translocase protein TatA